MFRGFLSKVECKTQCLLRNLNLLGRVSPSEYAQLFQVNLNLSL